MGERYLFGIDIGTQGTKALLMSTDGRLAADAFEESRLLSQAAGVVQQEPDDIYMSVVRTISDALAKAAINPSDVLAVGIDGQMAGVMGIDGGWNAVTYYDSWLDTRCGKYIDRIKSVGEERFIQITGCPVTYAHGPKVLWWKHEKPEAYRKIDKFVMPAVYAAGRLAGLKAESAYIDYTYLHFSGFGDIERNAWSEELLSLFGVRRDKMPQIVEPWKVIGRLAAEPARLCGLLPGTPIVAGCGDQAATSLGAGIARKGKVFDSAGTASVFSVCVDKYKPDIKNKTFLYARSVIPGLWIPLAYINGGGLCLKWFRDNIAGGEAARSYGELDGEAASIPPGSEGLIFIPHFNGRVCPNNPDARGGWLGLSWVHTKAHMFRAVMEGIAYEYKYYLDIIKELVGDAGFESVYAMGGGAKSTLFNTIKANVLGIEYRPLNCTDAAPLGSAVVAGYGVGVYKDLAQTAESFISSAMQIRPDPGEHELYRPYAETYAKLVERTAFRLNR